MHRAPRCYSTSATTMVNGPPWWPGLPEEGGASHYGKECLRQRPGDLGQEKRQHVERRTARCLHVATPHLLLDPCRSHTPIPAKDLRRSRLVAVRSGSKTAR